MQIFPLVVGWAGLGQSADGLGWVTQNGPMDNSGLPPVSAPLMFHPFPFLGYSSILLPLNLARRSGEAP